MRTTDITALVPAKTAAPTPQQMATRGTVTIPPASITDDTLTVILPSYSADYGWPCRWIRQGNTLPAIGAECLVLWDETGAGTVVQWAGAGVEDIPETVRLVGAVGQPAFANSWVNYDADRPASFYRHAGRVHLAGLVKSGTIGNTVFTLPAGYLAASANGLLFPVVSNGLFGFAAVFASGIVQALSGSNVYFSLDGISFRHV